MKPVSKKFQLQDGANIGVIGSGPSGTFFSYFFLDLAEQLGLQVNLDIIEAKDFNNLGPTGCNHCGGIISESLVQNLATEGIVLPSNVIRRGIDSYVMHTDNDNVKIETPLQEKRIGAVFRGDGPMGSAKGEWYSFDRYLQDLCVEKGANVILDKVVEISLNGELPLLKTKNKLEKSYDLIVGAAGLDNKTLKIFSEANVSYNAPATTKTYISEFLLGKETVSKYFGDSMHVFLMDIPKLEFGALIPKGRYVTLVLLGSEIDKELVTAFLNSPEVIGCFPEDFNLGEKPGCQCYPKINTQTAKNIFTDRFVVIGDSATSKLYKNGIGASYITAKAAATTAILNGVSADAFKQHYLPACKSLNYDNSIGKIVFLVTKIIKSSSILKRAVIKIVNKEQSNPRKNKNMSTVLWDTFTGSAPYREIFLRTVTPGFLSSLVWNTLTSLVKSGRNK
jgi:flavin-dependent dehydrogenase